MLHPELKAAICSQVDACGEIYLVGGVIRDYLLNKDNHDVDFVVKKNAISAARKIADRFNGNFYILDQVRGTGRSLIEINGKPLIIDFATVNGNGILDDLRLRDFTINAIAQDVAGNEEFIDPLDGIADLKAGRLKPCNPDSFSQDPVRCIRAVRFMHELNFTLDESTAVLIRKSASKLETVSAERRRDELFHVFEIGHVRKSLEIMREFCLWDELFPSLDELEKIDSGAPHVHNALEHTFQVIAYIQDFLGYIRTEKKESESVILNAAYEMLQEYRLELKTFLGSQIHADRQYEGLLFLAALYHDIGKTKLAPVSKGNKVFYPDHEKVSAKVFRDLCSCWALANDENRFIERTISNHMLLKNIIDPSKPLANKSIYRFYKQVGRAGVLISIFHLADVLATYEQTLTEKRWQDALQTSRALLDAWFLKYESIIEPPVLIRGDDLITEYGLDPGKLMGEILESVREAQAGGEVTDKESALRFAETYINEKAKQ